MYLYHIAIQYSKWFRYCFNLFQYVSITSAKLQEKSCMPSFSELILIQFHLIGWVQGKRCLGGQNMQCTNISGGEIFTSFGERTFTSILFQNVTQGIRGPHGGVANLVHFVKKRFLKRTTKKTHNNKKRRQKTHPLCRFLPILRRLLGWPRLLSDHEKIFPPPAVGWGKLPHYRCPKYTFPACRVWSPQFVGQTLLVIAPLVKIPGKHMSS